MSQFGHNDRDYQRVPQRYRTSQDQGVARLWFTVRLGVFPLPRSAGPVWHDLSGKRSNQGGNTTEQNTTNSR